MVSKVKRDAEICEDVLELLDLAESISESDHSWEDDELYGEQDGRMLLIRLTLEQQRVVEAALEEYRDRVNTPQRAENRGGA